MNYFNNSSSNKNRINFGQNFEKIYNDEFIALINKLNESIKEYYKITKNNNSEAKYVVQMNKKMNQTNLQLLSDFELNLKSNLDNLEIFFQKVKIIFHKLKEKRRYNLDKINTFRNNIFIQDNSKDKNSNRLLTSDSNMNRKHPLKRTYSSSTFLISNLNSKTLKLMDKIKNFNHIISEINLEASNNFSYLIDILKKNITEIMNLIPKNSNKCMKKIVSQISFKISRNTSIDNCSMNDGGLEQKTGELNEKINEPKEISDNNNNKIVEELKLKTNKLNKVLLYYKRKEKDNQDNIKKYIRQIEILNNNILSANKIITNKEQIIQKLNQKLSNEKEEQYIIDKFNINDDKNKLILKINNEQNSKKINNKIFDDNKNSNINIILAKLNEAEKKITTLEKMNEELITQLEGNKLIREYPNKYEEFTNSKNEEEISLPEIMNRVKEKNKDEDIKIDYPGAQIIREKYKELLKKLKFLKEQIKILLCNITITQKNRILIQKICQILEIPNHLIQEILNGKNVRKIFEINNDNES